MDGAERLLPQSDHPELLLFGDAALSSDCGSSSAASTPRSAPAGP
eukprot:SAG31_NODE_32691_length_352_cov_2.019763_2_plen_44_part_01